MKLLPAAKGVGHNFIHASGSKCTRVSRMLALRIATTPHPDNHLRCHRCGLDRIVKARKLMVSCVTCTTIGGKPREHNGWYKSGGLKPSHQHKWESMALSGIAHETENVPKCIPSLLVTLITPIYHIPSAPRACYKEVL